MRCGWVYTLPAPRPQTSRMDVMSAQNGISHRITPDGVSVMIVTARRAGGCKGVRAEENALLPCSCTHYAESQCLKQLGITKSMHWVHIQDAVCQGRWCYLSKHWFVRQVIVPNNKQIVAWVVGIIGTWCVAWRQRCCRTSQQGWAVDTTCELLVGTS